MVLIMSDKKITNSQWAVMLSANEGTVLSEGNIRGNNSGPMTGGGKVQGKCWRMFKTHRNMHTLPAELKM